MFVCFKHLVSITPLWSPFPHHEASQSNGPGIKTVMDSYNRGQEHPFFAGLLRGNESGSRSISRSTSDIGDFRSKNFSDISGKSKDLPIKDSVSDILEPFEQTAFGTLWKIPTSTSFEFQCSQFDSSVDSGGTNDIVKIPPPQSAASFYNGYSPQFEILESCDSTMRLNLYLKARKNDVNGGVPGKFLHAVIGQDVSHVGSLASIIMHAFYLNETLESDEFCTVPIINMKREDLSSHAELKWLLDSCHFDESSLIFIDEIDLSYYDLFGCLKLDLRNGHKLQTRQVTLKEAVVEVFNCRKAHFGESVYPWVENVALGQDCSCCTLISEKLFLISPELMAGKGFSRLLFLHIYQLNLINFLDNSCSFQLHLFSLLSGGQKLAGILMDTGNLTIPHCTTKYKYMLLCYSMVLVALDPIREILVSAETMEHMRNLLSILSSNASHLPLKAMHQAGLRVDMKAFEIEKVTSRKTIERLLEEFGGASKG
ncbi:hypothetical protein POTOM_003325 [Populus tomentosa]|uniref:DHHA2 domain-containing protein n=1 Tax=Populus tomentosa TaxID=118781 RepID=A0A8X8DLJ7_POPTO|nr:hypothetical protein POTOM_003325 [Populus tomentosa]